MAVDRMVGVNVPRLARGLQGGILAGLLLAGCVTSSEGEAMRTESARLKARIDEMDARNAEANKSMDRLRLVVDEASALLTRNSADLGSSVEAHEADLRKLEGTLAEIRHVVDGLQKAIDETKVKLAERTELLEQNQQKLIEKVAPTMPTDKEELWRGAVALLEQGKREEARRFYKNFLTRFPDDSRAAKVHLTIGKSYTLDGSHRQAAGTFQKVLDDYAKSSEVPEAMYELGRSFVELHFCSDARAIFTDMAHRFPKSPFAKEAREQANSVRKIQSDKTRCTS